MRLLASRSLGRCWCSSPPLCVPWLGSRFYTFLATDIAILALFADQPEPAARLHRPRLVRPRRLFRHRRLHLRDPDEDLRRAVRARASPRPASTPGSARCCSAAFCVRSTKIYFSMLTLAFAQIVWAICFKWNAVTGGEQGFPTSPIPISTGWRRSRCSATCASATTIYLRVLVLIARLLRGCCGASSARRSGAMLTAIRENPERAEFIGINVRRYQLAAFVVAGAFAGLRRRAVRHLQPRRLPRFRLLGEVGRSADHGDPRRHGALLGTGGRRRGADPAQPADHLLHASTGRSSSARS